MKGHFPGVIAATILLVATQLALAASSVKPDASSDRAAASTRCTVEVREGKTRTVSYPSLTDAFGDLYAQGVVDLGEVRVLNYSTFGSGKEKMIGASRAYFLIGADEARGSADRLNMVAFASRDAARKQQKKIGGELRSFDDAWEAAAQVWRQPAQEQRSARQSPPEHKRPARQPVPECFT